MLHACDEKAEQRIPVKNASNLDLERNVLAVRINLLFSLSAEKLVEHFSNFIYIYLKKLLFPLSFGRVYQYSNAVQLIQLHTSETLIILG